MEIFKLILLIVAYTIGIATLIIQILCYLKEIEYKETLYFSISFMLLILSRALSEFDILMGHKISLINESAFYFFIIVLSATTPVNVHAERIVKNVRFRNTFFVIFSVLLTLGLIAGFILNITQIIKNIIIGFLYLSIAYSMLLIITAKPSLLIKHREKAERRTAKVFLIGIPSYILIELLLRDLFHIESFMFDGVILLSFIFIALAISKLTDDIQRLSLFSEKNRLGTEKLARYNITQRESEVVDLLVRGKSYREIGEQLFISMPTVKTHISNIYLKMNINNKVELINLLAD